MPILTAVRSGLRVRLAGIDPGADGGIAKEAGKLRLAELGDRLGDQLNLLYAAAENSLLVILQGRDSAGKDGSIRRILEHTAVQSTRVEPFKVPNEEERAHDFLWRVHRRVPAQGEVVLFNRSHYEDVLAARVHRIVPETVWRRRYDHIAAFEDLLRESGTIVVKFFLHIDAEEQYRRLVSRENDPAKSWKLNPADWTDREYWDEYTAAYEELLDRCSPPEAPWYVVPANSKWFRDLAIADTLVTTLEPYEARWRQRLQERAHAAHEAMRAYREAHGLSAPEGVAPPIRPIPALPSLESTPDVL